MFPSLFMSDLERLTAVSLCLGKFVDDIRPAATADTAAFPTRTNPQEIGFALYEPDRESVNREDVQRFERHFVIAAKHILVSQEIG